MEANSKAYICGERYYIFFSCDTNFNQILPKYQRLELFFEKGSYFGFVFRCVRIFTSYPWVAVHLPPGHLLPPIFGHLGVRLSEENFLFNEVEILKKRYFSVRPQILF